MAAATYTLGVWSTLFASSPAAGAGVPVPDGFGSRFVVQVAKVTDANADNSPAPGWIDITSQVNRLDWLTGDPSGAISRWMIEQFTITTGDLTALLGDFVDLTAPTSSTAPTSGMFVRWGFRPADAGWLPLQSGIVESIEEIIAGRTRGWRLACFGTMLYIARSLPADENIDLGGVGSNLRNAINAVLQSAGTPDFVPWPWASTIAAQDTTLPTTVTVSPVTGSQLLWIHRLADSMGMRAFNTRTGGIAVELWGTTAAAPVRFSDEPAAVVAGHAPIADTIACRAVWKRSPDRTGGQIGLRTSDFALTSYAIPDQMSYTKWGWRSDVPGFPKLDLVGQRNATNMGLLATYARGFVAKELRLDRIECDTIRDPTVWSLLTGAPPGGVLVWTRSTPYFERRRPGTSWLEAQVFVNAVAGTIEFATGKGRAVVTYHTRLL